MASYFSDIAGALSVHLFALPDKPFIWYENAAVSEADQPGTNDTWIRESVLPSSVLTETLGTNAGQTHPGVYQLDVFAPLAQGRGGATGLADSIADHFKRNTNLARNGTIVRIINVSRRPAIQDGGWYKIIVEVAYLSRTPAR